MTQFIFITGGVVSSLGKGIAAASLGALLEARGLKVTMLKLDPYINVDPGTMSPFQHGEVYVTNDGAETDLDLGHYERFIRTTMSKRNNFTTGQIYEQVIRKNGAVITWAVRYRSFPISPTRSNAACTPVPRVPISRWLRSAERSATSSRCRFSRRFARWAWNWATVMPFSCT